MKHNTTRHNTTYFLFSQSSSLYPHLAQGGIRIPGLEIGVSTPRDVLRRDVLSPRDVIDLIGSEGQVRSKSMQKHHLDFAGHQLGLNLSLYLRLSISGSLCHLLCYSSPAVRTSARPQPHWAFLTLASIRHCCFPPGERQDPPEPEKARLDVEHMKIWTPGGLAESDSDHDSILLSRPLDAL